MPYFTKLSIILIGIIAFGKTTSLNRRSLSSAEARRYSASSNDQVSSRCINASSSSMSAIGTKQTFQHLTIYFRYWGQSGHFPRRCHTNLVTGDKLRSNVTGCKKSEPS
jgi:hypothetical protein